MSTQALLSGRLTQALTTPVRGVLGMVDELLIAAAVHEIRLDWQTGCCHLSVLGADSPDRFEIPVQKSVFRAALARVAALCNERIPDSVLPYGGQGEITVEADPVHMIRVKFVNTPNEQSLELTPVRQEGG